MGKTSLEQLSTKENNKKYAVVYFLLLKDKTRFKIGNSNEYTRRTKELESSNGKFDLENSILIECDPVSARDIEANIQDYFKEYNISDFEKKGGHTEWFSVECFSNAIKYAKFLASTEKNIFNIREGIYWESKRIMMNKQISLDKDWIKAITEHESGPIMAYIRSAIKDKMKKDGILPS